ncbi:MAG: hypothetical protein WB947_05620 [Thermoplasmata archaeon]
MAQGIDPSAERTDTGDDPFQRQVLRDQLDRVVEEKRRALEDPGPSWREWFFQSAAKWWIGLVYLIVDAWVVVTFLEAGLYAETVPAVIVALYLEFLLYRYLWYSPDLSRSRGRFHRTWIQPVPFGRWTPEADAARAHPSAASDAGPAPDEFL